VRSASRPISLLLRIVSAVAMCLGLMIVTNSSANAAELGYCQILVQPHSACPETVQIGPVSGVHRFENHARYPGTGNVRVCQHTKWWDGNSWETLSRTCANNRVTSGDDLFRTYNGHYLLFTVGNASDNRHTINGRVYGL
jgi:hypothetical protein